MIACAMGTNCGSGSKKTGVMPRSRSWASSSVNSPMVSRATTLTGVPRRALGDHRRGVEAAERRHAPGLVRPLGLEMHDVLGAELGPGIRTGVYQEADPLARAW